MRLGKSAILGVFLGVAVHWTQQATACLGRFSRAECRRQPILLPALSVVAISLN